MCIQGGQGRGGGGMCNTLPSWLTNLTNERHGVVCIGGNRKNIRTSNTGLIVGLK